MARVFLTVEEELLDVADRLGDHFESNGYSVKVEDRSRTDYPYMPTLRCKRASTTILMEVVGAVPGKERLREWKAYCSSQNRDTRFALGMRMARDVTAVQLGSLKADGIGLLTVGEQYEVLEILNPHDLPLNLQPPSLGAYPNRVRKTLAPAWEELNRGNWREGFDAACVALEGEVRKYLIRNTRNKRIGFSSQRGKKRVLLERDFRRMSMGQLKDALRDIVNPNHADSILHTVLDSLNPDRILVAHRRQEARAEVKLRKKVPSHLWSIVRGVEQAIK
jgi:hypothetical protein